VLDGAAGQVDAAPVGPQDAQGGAAASASDDELRARAEALLGGRGRGQPGDLAGSGDGGEGCRDGLDLAGATAVSVGTANFYNPCASEEVAAGIAAYLEQTGTGDIRELIGAVR